MLDELPEDLLLDALLLPELLELDVLDDERAWAAAHASVARLVVTCTEVDAHASVLQVG